MQVIIVGFIISIITSIFTTKIITIKYFSVIDGYVKKLIEDIKQSIRDAAGNEKLS